jgi:CarboxypepD_reg-like domain
MKKNILFFAFLFVVFLCEAQQSLQKPQKEELVQFSGQVLTEEGGQLVPVIYANVYLKNRKRGTYTDSKGFFSFVAAKGEPIVFSSVGFKAVEKKLPDTLTQTHYSIIQLMSKDNTMLPEMIVFPWPSKEHFKIEFLAMDVTDKLEEQAAENLAEKHMSRMRRELVRDGGETGNYYLREQAKQAYYAGQFRPMNIFNPMAWGKFIQDWKAGKFKRKMD